MSSYGRNFEFRVPPVHGERGGRYVLDSESDDLPIGVPLVATGDQVQALQRLDACRLEFVALDLRVKRHEQPYIVPGGGQPAR